MRFGALGPVEVVSAGGPVNLVSVERLVDLIWDERPPTSVVALVHTYISLLRRGFAEAGAPPALATRAPGYVLEVNPSEVDLVLFARHRDEARRAEQQLDFAAAAEHHRRAPALWRGPAFGGVDAQFARTRAVALEDERSATEEGLSSAPREAIGRLGVLSGGAVLLKEGNLFSSWVEEINGGTELRLTQY